MNRYYSSGMMGRFLTADPYQASGGVADPGSWNRHEYTQGDPVNFTDAAGLQRESYYLLDCTTYGEDEGERDHACMMMDRPLRRGSGVYADKGGGGMTTLAYSTYPQEIYRARAAEAVRLLKEQCRTALSNVMNLSSLAGYAGTMTFYDSNNTIMGSWSVVDILGFGKSTNFDRLREVGKGNNAVILQYNSGVISSNVVLGSQFFDQTLENQDATLVHEALHGALNMNDPTLAGKVGLGSFNDTREGVSAASVSIGLYLRHGCLPVQ